VARPLVQARAGLFGPPASRTQPTTWRRATDKISMRSQVSIRPRLLCRVGHWPALATCSSERRWSKAKTII